MMTGYETNCLPPGRNMDPGYGYDDLVPILQA
jgi:hypothetical protein